MTLPNFLIIGQMKAGTTSLYAYLRPHPQIFMPEIKEARFFNASIDDPTRPSWVKKGLPASLAEYEKLFDPVTDEVAIGEASPQYLQSELAAPQIKRCLPNVRLIVSLRRPSDRLYSLHLMMQRVGQENRDFATAFREDRGDRKREGSSTYDALKRFYELFDRSHIEAIRFEDLKTQTERCVNRVYAFLGVDTQINPVPLSIHNEGGVWKSPKLGKVVTSIRGNFLLKARLKRVIPARAWAYTKRKANQNIVKAAPLSAEMRHEVSSWFREDTLKVQDLTGLDLSDWLRE
jgi:hypothetical protein